MAEPSGLRAALQEHEARPCQALAANQASLKQSFVGHSPQFGTVGLAEALSPSEVADERVWWSEALTAQVIRTTAAQTQQILSFVSEEIQKQTEVLQFSLAASTRSAAAEAPPGGEAHALSPRPRDGAPRGGLEALLEQEISERRASETGLRKVMEEQGAALEGMSRALAGLEALLRPPGGAPEAPPAAPPAAECVPDVGEASERSAPMKHETSDFTRSRGIVQYDRAAAHSGSGAPGRHVSMEWPGMELRKQCRRLCHSRQFVLFTVCMIVANSALLGFEANEAMTSPDLTLPDGLAYRIAHASFALVFVIELALRWFGDGCTFLSPRNPEIMWNCFDTLIICLTVVEELLKIWGTDVLTFGFLRMSRILRLARMMRAFKIVRELKELRIMVTGIMHCLRPLFWASVLIVGLTYMTAVLISQILTDHMRTAKVTDTDVDDYIEHHFSTLGVSMYSLFEALTGGRDWGDIAEPFMEIHWMLVCCLVLYITIGVFCLLNLLTAVFLEAAQRMDDVQDLVYTKRDWVDGMKAFFVKAAGELSASHSLSDQKIRREDFITLMKSKTNVKFLEENGLDLCFAGTGRLEQLFNIMDEDGNGDLDVSEFVNNLYDLKGPARALEQKLEHQKIMGMIDALRTDSMSRRLSWRAQP